MGKIGTNNLGNAKRAQQNQVAARNRQAINKAELKDVKGDVATGIGAQDKKTKKKDETKKKAPVETFTPTKVEKTDDEKALKSQDEVKSEAQQQETAQVGTGQVGDEAAAPQEKSTDDLQTEFLNSFASNLDPDTMRDIGAKSNKSLDGMAAKGIEPPPKEVVMAAHSYNHAKSIVSQKMPGASQKEVRAAAKNDPELAKAVKLLDDSSAFINAKKNETLADAGMSAESGAPGDSSKAGAPGDTPQGGAAEGVDPFAKSPGDPTVSDDGTTPNGPNTPTGEGGDAGKKPWHVSPETQAQMMHENHQTMLKLMETMAEMAKERRETMAKIMQMNAETATSISEIFTQIHARRAAAHHKHFQLYMKILTDSWG